MLKLLEEKQFVAARALMAEQNSVDLAEFLGTLEPLSLALIAFRLMPKEQAAEVFAYLERDQQQRIVEGITDKELAGIVGELFLDDTVDFLEEMPASVASRVIRAADKDTRRQINHLLMYPEDSAGSLMTIECLELRADWSVKRAIENVRQNAEGMESISTLYVTDNSRRLEGVIGIKALLTGKDEEKIAELMTEGVISVNTHEDQAEVAELFKKYDFVSLPVVDTEERLVGIITIDDVVDVMEEETTEDIYKMAAMEPIETNYRDASVFTLARKRIVWLMVLMISATFTGMIIQHYNSALSANVLLASFIPMLMDTSGNAGSQTAVAVIRGLVLGEIAFSDMLLVVWKEFRVSVLVGAMMAIFNFGRVMIMNQDVGVALTVAIALFCTVVAAKIVGCILPLVATKCKLDPALMASPMITTIVDAVALLIYFNMAMLFIPGLSA